MPMGLSQKNKLVIYSTTYAGLGGTHSLQVGAGFPRPPAFETAPIKTKPPTTVTIRFRIQRVIIL